MGEVPALPRWAPSRRQLTGETNRELQLFEESVDGLRTYLTLVDSLRGGFQLVARFRLLVQPVELQIFA